MSGDSIPVGFFRTIVINTIPSRGTDPARGYDDSGVCLLRTEFLRIAASQDITVCNILDDRVFDVSISSFVPPMFPARNFDRGVVTYYNVDAHLVETYHRPEGFEPADFMRRNKCWHLSGFGSKVHACKSVDDAGIKAWRNLFVELPGVAEPFHALCAIVWPHWRAK